MKGKISHKLHSQKGASLLLALLFLLICSMTAVSILMAAAANAGKHRSNLEEHQIYLSLSSAVSALCDALNEAQYQGKYIYREEQQPVYDENNVEIGTIVLRYLTQTEGTYNGRLSPLLLKNFDSLFAAAIQESPVVSGFTQVNTKGESEMRHTLTLALTTGTALDDTPVHVTLEVKDSYAIYLSAWLEGSETYKIEAELTPTESKPTLSTPSAQGEHLTAPMKWKIGWITTGKGEETTP